jgi:hypothetical protein
MMSSLKTFAGNISSEETEVLNAVKTRSQTEDKNIWTIWKAGYSITELKSFQENNEDIGLLMQWKIDGARPLRSEIVKIYLFPVGVTGSGPNISVDNLSQGAPVGILPRGALDDFAGGLIALQISHC